MSELSWDDYADGWDDEADVRWYADQAFASLQDVLAGLETNRVLDFGCGTGLLSTKLAERFDHVVALDASAKMVAVLNAKPESQTITTLVGDIEDPSFQPAELAEGSFDLIVASSVCSFLKDYEGALKRLATLLRSGGVFVQWDWQASEEHEFGFQPKQIEKAHAAAGLVVKKLEPAFSLEGREGETMTALMAVGIR